MRFREGPCILSPLFLLALGLLATPAETHIHASMPIVVFSLFVFIVTPISYINQSHAYKVLHSPYVIFVGSLAIAPFYAWSDTFLSAYINTHDYTIIVVLYIQCGFRTSVIYTRVIPGYIFVLNDERALTA